MIKCLSNEMASSKIKSGNALVVVPFNLPSDLSSATVGQNIALATLENDYSNYGMIGVDAYVFGQWRNVTHFNQFAVVGSVLYGSELTRAFLTQYNSAPAKLILF